MASIPDPAQAAAPRRRFDFALRGLRSLLFGAVVAVCLVLLFQQPFGHTLIYSLCIASACWAFIDGGRSLAARWVAHRARAAGLPADVQQWPGIRWMVAVVIVGTIAGSSLGTLLGNLITGAHFPRSEAYTLRGLASFLIVSMIPATLITYFFYSREAMAAQRQKVESAERLATENRLKLLESQLEPHMLFNTLANLRVLIALDAERAQTLLDLLIGFLRATLGASRVGQHALEAEFARLADYLALIEIRMGARLQSRFELPADLASVRVPSLLLQPLVENAVKHGLEPHVAGGRIDVRARRDAAHLVLEVRDTGVGLAHPSADATRFGLTQVRERLAALYGARASLELSAADDAEGGTRAVVRMPLDALH